MRGFESSFSQEVFLETIQGDDSGRRAGRGQGRGGGAWVWGERGLAHIGRFPAQVLAMLTRWSEEGLELFDALAF